MERKYNNLERISSKAYNGIENSKVAVGGFLETLNSFTNKDYRLKGELKIGYDNFTNIDLLKTNADMLNEELFFDKDPNKIMILSEAYLTKLGAIGTLTLEQISSSFIGKYDPFKPGKKPKFNEIKRVIESYARPELKTSFLEGFCGIFNEVRSLRNKSAHSNLIQDILIKDSFDPGSWDSERAKENLYGSKSKRKIKKYRTLDDDPDDSMGFLDPNLTEDKLNKIINANSWGIPNGDLLLKSELGDSSLTGKLNEYSLKYLKMVGDVYSGLKSFREQFTTETEINYPNGEKSKTIIVDILPKDLESNPFVIKF